MNDPRRVRCIDPSMPTNDPRIIKLNAIAKRIEETHELDNLQKEKQERRDNRDKKWEEKQYVKEQEKERERRDQQKRDRDRRNGR